MTIDPRVGAYFDKLEGEVQAIALALSALIETRGQSLTCRLVWGFPCWSGNERIFSIIGYRDKCNLQLWSGHRLAVACPRRIEGTGKQLRHVKLHALSALNSELENIIDAAIRLDATDPEKVL